MDLSADDFDGDEYWYAVHADRDFYRYMTEASMIYRPLLGWQFGPLFRLSSYFVSDGTEAVKL
jgi:hypothetical protein